MTSGQKEKLNGVYKILAVWLLISACMIYGGMKVTEAGLAKQNVVCLK